MILSFLIAQALALTGYHQHPTVAGDRLVFEAEGDLWVAPLTGGTAERLTSHVEVETQPALSPDGRLVAFLGGYDGGREVYVMPVVGGAPRRITFEDSPLSVEGWTPAGEVLISSAARPAVPTSRFLRAIDPASLVAKDWPLDNANQGTTGPDGTRVFTRFGAHTRGDHARLYRGGAMASLWILRPGAGEATPLLPELEANAQDPLWVGERVYFLSDVTGRYQLHSVDAAGGDRRQHTTLAEQDVRRADTDGRSIVFQVGADLHVFRPDTGLTTRVDVGIRSDLDDARQRWIDAPLDHVSSMELAPSGEQVAITTRGHVALIGTADTPRRVIGFPDGMLARGAQVSPDGRWVYAVADHEGHEQIVRVATDDPTDLEVLTDGTTGRRWRLTVSPDGARVAHADGRGDLWLTHVASRRTTRIANEPSGDDVFAVTFSPDSRLLAFARAGGARTTLHLHDIASGRTERVASERFAAHSPAFSPDGAWLWFISDRHFDATPGSPWGDRNMGPAFLARGGLYGLALTADARSPFLSPSRQNAGPVVSAAEQEPKRKTKRAGKRREAEETTQEIEWEGLADRLYTVPVAPGDHIGLAVSEAFLYVLSRRHEGAPTLSSIALDPDAEVERVAEGVVAFGLSADRKTLFVGGDDDGVLVPAEATLPEDLADAGLNLEDWRLSVVPAEEWRASFDDAWRLHRDHAFDPAMRGLDWDAVYTRLRPLADRVTHRAELDDVLGLMAAELGILHSQVRGAELPSDQEGGRGATLAIAVERHPAGLEIVERFDGDPDLLEERSPLARPEVDVSVGAVLTHLNGRPLRTRRDLVEGLVDQADRLVRLGVREPDGGTREVTVVPLPSGALRRHRYRSWERSVRGEVDAASDGRIGYVHLQAMGGDDIADFAREYFAVSERAGLIIDVRGNSGGNIDSWIIGELARTAWAFWQTPVAEEAHGFTNMQRAFRGHLAVLIDQGTYSDGETFAAGIKALGLGPLIGTRTAGAGVWLSDRNRLADGGRARVGEYAQFDLDGRWIVEGRGVSPDIEVINPPVATWNGEDAQLARAMELLRERIAAEPIPILRGEPIPPVGTNAEGIRPLSER